MASFNILCVHGVGHGDEDPMLVPSWTEAITANIKRWDPNATVTCDFLSYDDLLNHVQNGGVKDDIVTSLLGRTFTSELALREALANAVADSSNPKFKEDVRSRKLTIAQGKGIVHGGSFVLKNWGLDEIVV